MEDRRFSGTTCVCRNKCQPDISPLKSYSIRFAVALNMDMNLAGTCATAVYPCSHSVMQASAMVPDDDSWVYYSHCRFDGKSTGPRTTNKWN